MDRRTFGGLLHVSPDRDSTDRMDGLLDERIGNPVAEEIAGAILRPKQEVNGGQQSRFPDEEDRVDLVLGPPLQLIQGPFEPRRFGVQAAMREEDDAWRASLGFAIGDVFRDRPREHLVEMVEACLELPLVRQQALRKIDDMRQELDHRLGSELSLFPARRGTR